MLAACAGAAAAAPTGDQAPLLERQYLTGEWNGSGHCSSPTASAPISSTPEACGRTSPVATPPVCAVNGYLDFGFEVDLAKLGAWDGLGFHADFHWWQGGRPTQRLIGGLIAMALSDWEAAATLRVFNLYLRQAFDGDRFVVKPARSPPTPTSWSRATAACS